MDTIQDYKHTNQLIKETSPYLLQHAHNPVDWFPWSQEAFDKAKIENKLVLISIGYAACHWCHVMEHESFENEAIAALMNEHFVCIKVDREERPDIDKIYMDAVQLLTGSGGWPLNCFALPDGRPVYGGTYFQPNQWKNILTGLSTTYAQEPEKILHAAEEITSGILKHHIVEINDLDSLPAMHIIDEGVKDWSTNFDKEWGGNNRAPKFPMPVGLSFLQEYAFYTSDSNIESHLEMTLNKMALGGIYDQIGGAFSRYSVDKYWKVPHFEKMLYDNGQLLSVYANAYRSNANILYKRIIEQTVEFANKELKSPENAYYSSYDADSEGVEGKFYVWSRDELVNMLDKEEHWVLEYFNVSEQGNWEEGNILWVTHREEVMLKLECSEERLEEKLNVINEKLFIARQKRIYPGLDNKVLTSWNALMGIGLLDAYAAIQNQSYLNNALELAQFFEHYIIEIDGKLYRNYTNNKANIEGFSEDYALLIKFYIRLYQYTFDEHYLEITERITSYFLENFYDKESSMFYYTHNDAKGLINRTLDLSDNVIPSSNAIMAHNLLDMSILLSNKAYYNISIQMLKNVIDQVSSNIPYYAHWASLWQRFLHPQFEVVFCGKDAISKAMEFRKHYVSNVFIAGSIKEQSNLELNKGRWVKNESLIYVCKNKTCKLPVKDVNKALELLK